MNAFLKLQQIRNIVRKRKKSYKNSSAEPRIVYLHVILFRIHEGGTGAEKEFDTILQVTLEQVLTQRLKQNTKWTAKVTK